MRTKIGIHMLTAFPPSNPNRDENGQPKSAVVGGVKRQRISSQCIKRTWRLSDLMLSIEANFSTRTRGIGLMAEKVMIDGGIPGKLAREYAMIIAGVFGKLNTKKKGSPELAEMVTVGHEERDLVLATARVLAKDTSEINEKAIEAAALIESLVKKPPVEKKAKKTKESDDAFAAAESSDEEEKQDNRLTQIKTLLQIETTSLDVGMFGRMRASSPKMNVDASISVSHPLTTGKSVIDSDYWTAVDDLTESNDETGAGGMGDVEFGSGTYYTYVVVDLESLISNIGGDKELARTSVLRLVEAMTQESPGGHKNTFNNAVRASYVRVEVGSPSSHLYCSAYEKPVEGTDKAIEALRNAAQQEAFAYSLDEKQSVFEFNVKDCSVNLKGMLAQLKLKLESC